MSKPTVNAWGAVRVKWKKSEDGTHWFCPSTGQVRTLEEMDRMSKHTFDRFTVTDPVTGKDVTKEFLDKIPQE
jgi:hypothetical protein